MADILFAGKKHEDLFFELFKKMKRKDCYHGAAAYLLSLDPVIQDHINNVFDFKEDVIKPECLRAAWQTGTSKKTTRLLFNLWNGTFKDPERPADEDEEIKTSRQRIIDEDEAERERCRTSMYYAPDEIFSCSYAPYYWQAIQLRYPEYSEP